MLTPGQAREYVGVGRDRFRRLVREGVIPSFQDPDTGFRYFSRLRLDAWAANLGDTEVAS